MFVEITLGAEIAALHRRSDVRGDIVCDPQHYLSLLEKKPSVLNQAAPRRFIMSPPLTAVTESGAFASLAGNWVAAVNLPISGDKDRERQLARIIRVWSDFGVADVA